MSEVKLVYNSEDERSYLYHGESYLNDYVTDYSAWVSFLTACRMEDANKSHKKIHKRIMDMETDKGI